MFNVLFARTCVPGGLSRAAWAPSLSPWGASLGGGLGPMSAAQKWLSPLGIGIVFYIDFDIDF